MIASVVDVTSVIAHRGARRVAKENTERAFRLAVEMGADGIELDVRRTSDDVLVIHHDPVTAAGRLIHTSLARELDPDIPTLAAAIDACEGAIVNIEIKNSPDDPGYDPDMVVVELVTRELDDRGGSPMRWVVSCFDLATLNEFHRLRPEVPTALLSFGSPEEALRAAVRDEHPIWHPYHQDLSLELLRAAQDFGLLVNVWTTNEPADHERLIEWGVDGIITDVPDVAVAVRGGYA